MQRTKDEERKADTRNKIQLGGLVVKAGLGEEETAVLLGAFIEAADSLNGLKRRCHQAPLPALRRRRLQGESE